MHVKIDQPLLLDQPLEDYLDAAKSAVVPRPYGRTTYPLGGDSIALGCALLLDLVKHQQQAKRSIGILRSQVNTDEGRQAIRALSQSANILGGVLRVALGADYASMAPTASSALVAQKVFDIPELAEMILMELSAKELLATSQVNHAFHDCIHSWTKIKLRLGLLSDVTSFWRSNLTQNVWNDYNKHTSLPGVFCSLRGLARPQPSTTMELQAYRDNNRHGGQQTLRVGKIGREMLICQPPIKKLTAFLSCCNPRSGAGRHTGGFPPPPARPSIENTRGITVGDILDATERLKHEHRNCPWAPYSQHDETSMQVNVKVEFQGFQKLRAEDPALPVQGDESDYMYPPTSPVYSPMSPMYSGMEEDDSLLRSFVNAKHDALRQGANQPVPEEFAEEWYGEAVVDETEMVGTEIYWTARNELESMEVDADVSEQLAMALTELFLEGQSYEAVVSEVDAVLGQDFTTIERDEFADWFIGMASSVAY